jgi:hypothetical protein
MTAASKYPIRFIACLLTKSPEKILDSTVLLITLSVQALSLSRDKLDSWGLGVGRWHWPTYAHNTEIAFGSVDAKYVRLTCISNDAGSHAGLSEVRFYHAGP